MTDLWTHHNARHGKWPTGRHWRTKEDAIADALTYGYEQDKPIYVGRCVPLDIPKLFRVKAQEVINEATRKAWDFLGEEIYDDQFPMVDGDASLQLHLDIAVEAWLAERHRLRDLIIYSYLMDIECINGMEDGK